MNETAGYGRKDDAFRLRDTYSVTITAFLFLIPLRGKDNFAASIFLVSATDQVFRHLQALIHAEDTIRLTNGLLPTSNFRRFRDIIENQETSRDSIFVPPSQEMSSGYFSILDIYRYVGQEAALQAFVGRNHTNLEEKGWSGFCRLFSDGVLS